jgi:hypothetical protein
MIQTSFRYRAILLAVVTCMLSSCATYHNQANQYYECLERGDYEKAHTQLSHLKILSKSRNRILLLLETGRLAHLRGEWEASNTAFNEADNMIEDGANKAANFISGTLLNPMMGSYRPESFERYLVHYYKALNYLNLGQTEEAVVEARRISLSTFALQDEQKNEKKYASDAFAYSLQGMIYEKNKDFNNAFISYRNAADIYLENKGNYYGINIPGQLQKDLLRAAALNQFNDELQRYENLFGTKYNAGEADAGELILFWENGSAPVKEQKDIYFSLIKNGDGNFFFRDNGNVYNVPYDNGINNASLKAEDIRSFRVALPGYKSSFSFFNNGLVIANGKEYSMEEAEDVTMLAIASLNQRLLKELSSALTRMAIKKIAEAAVRPDENKKEDPNKTAEEKKKEEKKKNQREALAMGVQLFNLASEKADTRNWQSLPGSIYYTRIPLVAGENKIMIRLTGQSEKNMEITVTGNGSMQFRNIFTPRQ